MLSVPRHKPPSEKAVSPRSGSEVQVSDPGAKSSPPRSIAGGGVSISERGSKITSPRFYAPGASLLSRCISSKERHRHSCHSRRARRPRAQRPQSRPRRALQRSRPTPRREQVCSPHLAQLAHQELSAAPPVASIQPIAPPSSPRSANAARRCSRNPRGRNPPCDVADLGAQSRGQEHRR